MVGVHVRPLRDQELRYRNTVVVGGTMQGRLFVLWGRQQGEREGGREEGGEGGGHHTGT